METPIVFVRVLRIRGGLVSRVSNGRLKVKNLNCYRVVRNGREVANEVYVVKGDDMAGSNFVFRKIENRIGHLQGLFLIAIRDGVRVVQIVI